MSPPVKVSPNQPCPCGSGAKYKKCCGVYHRGKPAEPPRLMRARYCAYAIGRVDFLIGTTHPDGPLFRPDTKAWARELEDYCSRTSFTRLMLHDHGAKDDAEAYVTFTAAFDGPTGPGAFTERSTFRRDGKQWKYFDGEVADEPVQ
jgi:SEC-C motif-containing protein